MQDDKIPSKDTPIQKTAPAQGESTESGGPKGAEPTRYGDWCLKGKCVDF